ncbi:hypothetical protein [Paraburkholderia caballeronis]|uniref:hypothetical protein n=1 Tax=Paraburkholderia caballeronis TaxID=416943 RepID=UPI0010646A65|nr:hypothetical protein [Paraburkholderia caballeronis]
MSQKQSTELTVVERASLALNSSENRTKLAELVAQSTSIVEIKNAAARDQAHAAAMTLRGRRTEIRRTGKEARDDATKFSKAVIAEEDELVAIIEPEEQRLLSLRDDWDERIAAEKRAKVEAEARRIAAIREHIDDIRAIASRCVGLPSERIEIEIEDLGALEIDITRFAEMTGNAEAARGETLGKLHAMHTAALAQEAEARRVAEESERLARERATFEAEQHRVAAERAEQERRDAAARAERERVERERREAEEAVRREQQAREDAERRAALEAEERRMAAEREEMQRRQAELARAEREAQEREEARLAAEREKAEHLAREQREREEAEAREAARRERDDFLVRGPGLDAIVDVIGAHYNVEAATVLYWLFIYDVPATTAPETV